MGASKKSVKAVRFSDLYKTTSFSPLAAATPTAELRTLSSSGEEEESTTQPPPSSSETSVAPPEVGAKAPTDPPEEQLPREGAPVLEPQQEPGQTQREAHAPEASPENAEPREQEQQKATISSASPVQESEKVATATTPADGQPVEAAGLLQGRKEQQQQSHQQQSHQQQEQQEQREQQEQQEQQKQEQQQQEPEHPAALFNFSALSLATGRDAAEGLMAPSETAALLSAQEASSELARLGVAQPRLRGLNSLPDGGVVVAVPRPGVALHRITASCAATLRAPQLQRTLQELRGRIDALSKEANADTLDGLDRALQRLPKEARRCAPELQEASVGVTQALAAWKSARSTHASAHRAAQRAREGLQRAQAELEKAKATLQSSARDAEKVERQAMGQLRLHWGALRNTVARSLLVAEQLS